TTIPLNELDLRMVNHSGDYHIKASAYLAQVFPTRLQFAAKLTLDPRVFEQVNGQVFLSAKNVILNQWKSLIPRMRLDILDGTGDVELWLDLGQGRVESAQTKLHFNQLAWVDKQTQQKQLLQLINANLAWNPTTKGWQLTGDH